MPYRILLSDADGTLFDFHAGERVAISEAFAAFGVPDTPENADLYRRVNDAQWKKLERGETTQARLRVDRFSIFLAEAGCTADAQRMCDCFVERLGQQRMLISGALAFCRRVAARMPVYLVTNGISTVQRSRFEHCALTPYIAGLVISEEIGAAKPDPAMVREALRLAGGVDPCEAVLLGDSVTADIPAARNAGVDSILFTNGGAAPQNHGATYVARDFAEAERLILPCQDPQKAVE